MVYIYVYCLYSVYCVYCLCTLYLCILFIQCIFLYDLSTVYIYVYGIYSIYLHSMMSKLLVILVPTCQLLMKLPFYSLFEFSVSGGNCLYKTVAFPVLQTFLL